MKKYILRNMLPNEIDDMCLEIGEKKFRSKQIYGWIVKGVREFSQMKNLSKDLIRKLEEVSEIGAIEIAQVLSSETDGTKKYLFELHDGSIIESVFMKYKHGNTVCVSTQVGCRMGCTFCASTIGGVERNLDASEIISQIYEIQNDTGERVSNVVLMGSGEPLDNTDNVVKFIKLLNEEGGLNVSQRNMTLSTCGIVPEIYKLADMKLQITLAISLHSSSDEERSALMPINRKYNIEELLKACKYYTDTTGRRVTFEYALIKGKNDVPERAKELAKLLKGFLCHVNLIPINLVVERDFVPSSDNSINSFRNILKKSGIETTIRRELGSDINAACGQLRKSYKEKKEEQK